MVSIFGKVSTSLMSYIMLKCLEPSPTLFYNSTWENFFHLRGSSRKHNWVSPNYRGSPILLPYSSKNCLLCESVMPTSSFSYHWTFSTLLEGHYRSWVVLYTCFSLSYKLCLGRRPDDRRYTTDYGVFLRNCLVSCCAKKQSVVSRSSTKAEYRALAMTIAEVY